MATVVKLSREELGELIDQEARACLGMSGTRFRTLWSQGKLRRSVAAHEIAMLLRLDKDQANSRNGKR
jgi:hypothetical protein